MDQMNLPRHLTTFAFCTALVLATGAWAQSAPAPRFPPKLPDVAKDGYFKQYVPAPKHKSFAVSVDGQRYAAVYGMSSPDEAARQALASCLAQFKAPCRLWLVNDDDHFSKYALTAKRSAEAVAKLPASLDGKAYADEAVDHQVALPTSLRPGTEVHGATPLSGPAGTTVIGTEALLQLYRTEKRLVLMDVLLSRSLARQTLPKANWVFGAGWEQADLNATIKTQLGRVMGTLAPRKDTPIVTFCSNRDCWLSWNAALRLKEAGYQKVYWYRGGVDSWRAAGLPLIETYLYSHLW